MSQFSSDVSTMQKPSGSVFLTATFKLDRKNDDWIATVNNIPSIVVLGRTLAGTHESLRAAISNLRPDWTHVVINSSVVFSEVV